MALRAQRVLHLVGELDVAAARGEAHGLEVEHAAATQAALHGVEREIEVLGPVGGENHACKMTARRVARNVDSLGIAAEAWGKSTTVRSRASLADCGLDGRRG